MHGCQSSCPSVILQTVELWKHKSLKERKSALQALHMPLSAAHTAFVWDPADENVAGCLTV